MKTYIKIITIYIKKQYNDNDLFKFLHYNKKFMIS